MILSIARKLLPGRGDRLSEAAKREKLIDGQGLPAMDPGHDSVIEACIGWLARAQDNSLSHDGGVARHYSLLHGWASSYPETTGYIIPTFLEYARLSGDLTIRDRARKMLDWLVRIQLPVGGFQGGKIDSTPVVPVTFNTGQILLGLAAGVAEFGDYRDAMRRAADWLVATQDKDGCWRKHPTPFAAPGEKAYETHVAWGLLEASKIDGHRGYAEAAMANVHWALSKQTDNGWLRDCCLTDSARPLTHTLGYALRGMLEAYLHTPDARLLSACRRTADSLLDRLEQDGRLPGQFDSAWRPAARWVCLTGTVQIAYSWLILHRITGQPRYREAAFSANSFVRRTIRMNGDPNLVGGVKGSFPIDGDYGRFEYLNWAAKFCVDSNLLERDERAAPQRAAAGSQGVRA